MQTNFAGFQNFIKKCFFAALLSTSIQATSALPNTTSDEEAFLIRRIAEFWKDGDYAIVKEQIHDFIQKYPKSTLKDYLQGILGDLCLQQNDYKQALTLYGSITEPALKEKIILNKLQCYYEEGLYKNLYTEAEPYLASKSEDFIERKNEFHFILAESYFRDALTIEDEKAKMALMSKATPFYEGLNKTEFEEVSSFALAEIYRLSGQTTKAIDLYMVLAEKYPSKKEGVLFNAALLEANINKNSAIDLFNRVVALNGTKFGEASFNRLILYFQTEQYENVVNQHRLVYSHVPEDQMATYHFIVGKSYYNIKDYESAVLPFEKYILEQKTHSDQLRDALVLQLSCAKETSNEPLFDKSLAKLKTSFPSDQELGKAYFMHAMMLKKEGNFAKAEAQLKVIFDQKVQFNDQETLLYEYAIVCHENQKYDTSYQVLKHYLKDFSQSEKASSAWRYFLSDCLHLSKKEDKSSFYDKKVFLEDLAAVLAHKQSLSQDEIKEYRLLFAKLSYELSHYNQALENLTSYLKEYPEDKSLAEAHLLTALTLSKLDADPENFCYHLEKAIGLAPEVYNTSSLQLQLYNAYITRAQAPKIASDVQSAYYDKAATYLYHALKDTSSPIKTENQLWLASYYYNLSKSYLNQHWTHGAGDDKNVANFVDRSLEIYQKVLATGKTSIKSIDSSSLFLEGEVLKYADVAGIRGHQEKRIAILKSLVEQQNKHKDWNWQFKRQALYELASAQEKTHNSEAALETYSQIADFPSLATPITTASAMKSAKLKFDLLDKKQKNEKNSQVVIILNQLKDLQIRKSAISEPYHLEAGLEYIKIRTLLSPDPLKDSRYLFFLIRMKEDFTASEDTLALDYKKSLKENPEKQALYDSYMKFIDAEIFRMQAKQLASENKKEESQSYKQKAIALLNELEKSKSPTEFLHVEVAKSLKLVK